MAVVQMPAGAVFTKRAWTPPAQNQVNKSGWTGARKVLRLPGAGVWKVTAAIKPISREVDAWPWQAFLAVLEGEANTFYMPACDGDQWRAPGTPANAAFLNSGFPNVGVQGATQMHLGGLGAPGLKMYGGQKITVFAPDGTAQMLLLTQNLVADGQGLALATFRGALRRQPTDGSQVRLARPVCEMAMVGNPALDENEGVYTLGFDAEEAFT